VRIGEGEIHRVNPDWVVSVHTVKRVLHLIRGNDLVLCQRDGKNAAAELPEACIPNVLREVEIQHADEYLPLPMGSPQIVAQVFVGLQVTFQVLHDVGI